MGCGNSKDKTKPAKPRATRTLSKGSLKTQPVTNAPRSAAPGVTPEKAPQLPPVAEIQPDMPRKSSTSSFSKFFARLDAKVEVSAVTNDKVTVMVTSPRATHNNNNSNNNNNNTEQTIQEEHSSTPPQNENATATSPVPFADAFSPTIQPTTHDLLSPFEEDRVNEARNI